MTFFEKAEKKSDTKVRELSTAEVATVSGGDNACAKGFTSIVVNGTL
jgi:hypothetical protein